MERKGHLALFVLFLLFFYDLKVANAEELPRHMVEISTQGLGVGASYEDFDPESSSSFEDFEILEGNVALNYSYTFHPRFQLGLFIVNHTDSRKYETKDGRKGEIEYKTLLWGTSMTWNLAPDIRNAPYLRFIYSLLNHEEEYSKNVFNYLEDDRNSQTFELAFGKRFDLKSWGLEKLSFSPSLSVFTRDSNKDYDDDGIQRSTGFTVQILKFDLLF